MVQSLQLNIIPFTASVQGADFAIYEQQAKSNKARNIISGKLLKAEYLHEKIYSKHFKSHYAGRPTKIYIRLMEQINQSKQHTVNNLHLLLLYLVK